MFVIATEYVLDGRVQTPYYKILFSAAYRPVMGHAPPCIKDQLWNKSPGEKLEGRLVQQLPLTGSEVKRYGAHLH
jgi:hypothetical protein